MRLLLNDTRKPNYNLKLKNKVINSTLILLLGIIFGVFSKWLDNLVFDNGAWWLNIIERLDLNNFFSEIAVWLSIAITISVFSCSSLRASINVFLFFIGMCASYHLYTIIFSGFNPHEYMMRWYILTMISPLIAYICWYSKGENKISLMISTIIVLVMVESCFNLGLIYFGFKGILFTLVFISTCIVIYVKPVNLGISIVIGLLLAFLIRIPLISG